jgi:hypothetical protein
LSENNTETQNEPIDYLLELSSVQDFISQYGSGAGLKDVSLKEIYDMLRNPYKNITRIQNTSRYFSNRFGIVKDVNEAFKTLPSLNYHLVWSNFENPTKIAKFEKKIYELLETINIKKVVRDGLSEQAEVGTVVAVNRKNKFVQFLDLDKTRINSMINGKWIVEVDLSTISGSVKDIKAQIDSLPEEVTIGKYNQYRAKGQEHRFVPIKNAQVLNIRGTRNQPFGLPLTLSAWGTLLHKALIEQVEKSIADRKIKSLLVMYVKSILQNSEPYKPPKKDIIDDYFRNLTKLIKKKDESNRSATDNVGTGVMVLPSFFDLKEVELDTEMFSKELYDKLDNDLFANLGISSALVYGAGKNSNYGVSQMNSEKFYRYIFTALEDWEYFFNDLIKQFLPSGLDCKIFFDRTAIGDRESDITAKKDFYMQTGIFVPYAETLLGVPYRYALGLKEYQDKVLKLNELIYPPINPYTQTTDGSGNSGGSGESGKNGRPANKKKDDSENNIKAKGNKSNSIPSPSD